MDQLPLWQFRRSALLCYKLHVPEGLISCRPRKCGEGQTFFGRSKSSCCTSIRSGTNLSPRIRHDATRGSTATVPLGSNVSCMHKSCAEADTIGTVATSTYST
jgi:hypothetical protein